MLLPYAVSVFQLRSVLLTAPSKTEHQHVPSQVFQYAIYLTVNLSIGRDPSAFLNVSMVCFLQSHLFMCKGFYSKDTITTTSIQTVILSCVFPTVSSPNFALHSYKGILVWHSENNELPVPTAYLNYHLATSFILISDKTFRTSSQ